MSVVALVGVALFALVGRSAQSQTASPALSPRSNFPAAAATSRIAFISEPQFGGYCGVVYVMNADGSGQRRLVHSTETCGQEWGHAWSPDGRRIAIVSNGGLLAAPPFGKSQIYVMNADGNGQRKLTRGTRRASSPVWSPAQKK